MARKKFYIRLGDLPSGRSEISLEYREMIRRRTGEKLPQFEKGISVYPTSWSPDLARWVLFDDAGTAGGLGELWDLVERGDRPILLVSGRVVGEGSDGEPLLRRSTIQIEQRLTVADVYYQALGIEQLSVDALAALLPEDQRQAFIEEHQIERTIMRKIKRGRATPDEVANYHAAVTYMLARYRDLRLRVAGLLRALPS